MSSGRTPAYFRWRYLLIAYLILLISSAVVTRETRPDKVEISAASRSEKPVILFFRDPVLTSETELQLLSSEFELIAAPIMPNRELSFAAQAELSNAMLDSLSITEVHVAGQGIGGSTAIHMASSYAEKVKSLSLISANGILELELLGGYHLNSAVYGFKVGFFQFVNYGIPHFGFLDKLPKRITRAKIQYQSDQRKLRDLLQSIDMPVLIQHTSKARIPQGVSEEHHRLLPQSELILYDKQARSWALDLGDFIHRSETSKTLTRESAGQDRQIKSLLPFDTNNGIKAEGRGLVLLMIFIIFATFITEDLTCIGTGLMVARGLIGFFPGVIACLLGIFIGDILLFLAGRFLANTTLEKAPVKWFINKKDIEKSFHWFEAKGPAIIIISRFIPGSRFPTYFSAGAIGASFFTFILYFGIASILWTPLLVGLAVKLGQQMIDYFTLYQEYALWVLVGVLFSLYVLFKLIIPLFTFRGRRLLIGAWNRLIHWEFWPRSVIYFPVFFYIIYLWIKLRSITVFTAANPGIEEGGFIGESKSGILKHIGARESVAPFMCLSPETDTTHRFESVLDFMEKNSLDFPIVCKPDKGERGKGVQIIKSRKELEVFLFEMKDEYIIQEYIQGKEFGVFYYRYPREEMGSIFSVTKKEYMSLTGDGKHTLEELILRDERAVSLAEIHFEQHIDDLYEVPEKGEKVPIVELGTHARGAIFYDANELITEKLTLTIDRISQSFEGFYFGRYDVKVPSEDDLRQGKNITVLEVNGVTSESTNIYDPAHSFLYGQKILMKQWRIAYEIGAEVKLRNPEIKLPSALHLISLLR